MLEQSPCTESSLRKYKGIRGAIGEGSGEPFPRSGTPPPSPRGPESGVKMGVGLPKERGERWWGQLCFNQSMISFFFFFFLKKKPNSPNRGVAPSNGGVRGV
ncbi:hypothetical protein HanIR_Chr10g0492431 [Helianthus annuus]|nr:hypothetical protein HanIR_Chr10g0492431 [Helianthus annuus]